MSPTRSRFAFRPALLVALGAALVAASPMPAASLDSARVTRGEFSAFASGAGQAITGHADMVRSPSGTTFVTIHVQGLVPGGQYASHVHKAACATGSADGHFKQDPVGASAPPNEIWLGGGPFAADGGGVANARVTVDYIANDDAVSVVVHDLSLPSTANKIACAGLG